MIHYAEIYLFIQVGSVIGAIPTILLIIFTAIFGALLLRHQGLATLQNAQREFRRTSCLLCGIHGESVYRIEHGKQTARRWRSIHDLFDFSTNRNSRNNRFPSVLVLD